MCKLLNFLPHDYISMLLSVLYSFTFIMNIHAIFSCVQTVNSTTTTTTVPPDVERCHIYSQTCIVYNSHDHIRNCFKLIHSIYCRYLMYTYGFVVFCCNVPFSLTLNALISRLYIYINTPAV